MEILPRTRFSRCPGRSCRLLGQSTTLGNLRDAFVSQSYEMGMYKTPLMCVSLLLYSLNTFKFRMCAMTFMSTNDIYII